MGSAATPTDVTADPGIIAPTGAFYGAEVAIENAAANAGLISKEDVMTERAHEAMWANGQDEEEAEQRAADALGNIVSSIAQSDDTTGKEKAQAIITALQNNDINVGNAPNALAQAGAPVDPLNTGVAQNGIDALKARGR